MKKEYLEQRIAYLQTKYREEMVAANCKDSLSRSYAYADEILRQIRNLQSELPKT
ncbi:MAG: hypothetical protein LBD41_04915 [Clostridiales Family XIII bacterium]|jgi:hypothetical protein|nr:hypothetical protein [Clostridiales Family XIII bacterium]